MIDAIFNDQNCERIVIDVFRVGTASFCVFIAQTKLYTLEGTVHHKFGVAREGWDVRTTKSSENCQIVNILRVCDGAVYVCEDGYAFSFSGEKFKLSVVNITILSAHPIPSGLATVVKQNRRDEQYEINFYLRTNLEVKLFCTWTIATVGAKLREDAKPVLVRVGRYGTDDDDDDACSSGFLVDFTLFDLLFGSCSVGFLVAFPDGRIFTLSFASYPNSRCDVKLICRLKDGVVDILPLDDGMARRSICIVSASGRVLLISPSESHNDRLHFVDVFLCRPVVCCDAISHILLHSDGECVYKTDLSRGSKFTPRACCGVGAVTHLKIISPLRDSTFVALMITRDGRLFDHVVDLESSVEKADDLMYVSRSISGCFSRLNNLTRLDDELLRSIHALAAASTLEARGKGAFEVNCRFFYSRCALRVRVTNSSDVNLSAPCVVLFVAVTWPRHSVDQRLNQFLKCHPLTSGVSAAESIIVQMDLPAVALYNFPLDVTISLQLAVENGFFQLHERSRLPLAELHRQKCVVDELHLLASLEEFRLFYPTCLARKVWQLAEDERRHFYELFEMSPSSGNRHFAETSRIMVVACGNDELMSLICNDNGVVIDDSCGVFCGDQTVTFDVTKYGTGTTLLIGCKRFDELSKLRRAICSRLEKFPLRRSTSSPVSLPLEVFFTRTELSCALADFHRTNRVERLFNVYCRLRELISSKLPSACLF